MVVRVLPDSHAAVSIVKECQAAVLTASSSAIRHRAISIMRAMSNLLDAAPTPQHDINKGEVHHRLPAVPAVSPAAEARSATDATTDANEGNISAEDSFHDSAHVPPDAHSASISDPASQPQSMEQAFAMGMLTRQHGEGVAQVQPQQLPAEAEADTESGEEAGDEAGHAKEEQALAAARRQQTVDDAMDKLLEDLADEASSSKLPTPGRAASVSDMEIMNTADSGLLLLGSYASSSTASSTAAGTAPEREEQDFAYTYRYPHLEEDEKHQRQKEEDRAEEQGDKEVEKEDHGGEEGDDAELQALAMLEMHGYTGLERAFRQLPPPDSPPTCRSGPYAGRDRSLRMHEQGLMESGFNPRAAAEVASEEGASSSTPRLTAPTSSSAAAAAAAAAAAKPAVQTLARPNQQPSNRLPSLALSRSSRKIVKATPDEETVLVPSQQASGLTSHQPQAREQGKHLSPAEMQHLMEFVFQRGFEHMGKIADASLADPAASAADVDVPNAATTTMPDVGRVEKTHDEMQDAFNKLHGRQRHDNHNRTELKGGALSQAVPSATTTPITATRAATAGSSIPEGAAAVASASTSRHPSDMDSVPKALIARERARVARTYMEDEVPPFHSVFSRYGSNRHVREIQELTQCQRQVGFAAQQKQRPSQLKTAFKVLLPGVMLATGIATGMRRLCKG